MLSVGVILWATMMPGPDRWTPFNPWCLVCGERDASDAVLNVLLFAPLGFTLAASAVAPARVVLFGGLFSVVIELLQTVIPGRDPSIRDVMMNTLGTGAGVVFLGARGVWLTQSNRLASRLSLAAGALGAGAMVASGFLLQPSFSSGRYYGQWTQERDHGEIYRGRVLKAVIDSVTLPSAALRESDKVRELLRSGAEVRVSVLAGPQVPSFAPILGIAEEHAEEMTLGASRNDLVLRFRTRSATVLLDQPAIPVRGIMASAIAGDTLDLRVSRPGRGWCITLNHDRRCDLGFTLASAWRILYSGDSFPDRLSDICGLVWLAALVFPSGFWWRKSWGSWLGAGLLTLGLAFAPAATGLEPTTALQWTASLAGLLLGALVGRVVCMAATVEAHLPFDGAPRARAA